MTDLKAGTRLKKVFFFFRSNLKCRSAAWRKMKINLNFQPSEDKNYISTVIQSPAIEYQLGMILNNEVKNLLPLCESSTANKLVYRIESKQRLSERLKESAMNKAEFSWLVLNIIWSMKDAETYRLKKAGFVLDVGLIYLDPAYDTPTCIYLPIHTKETGLHAFFNFIRNLILNGNIESGNENFIQHMLDIISDKSSSLDTLARELYKFVGQDAPQTKDSLLSQTQPISTRPQPYYLECKDGEMLTRILLDKEHFTVGRRKAEADYVCESTGVSRVHAYFELEDGRVYITDNDSRNGTYINGDRARLEKHVRHEIFRGYSIKMADVEFELQ